MFCSTLRSLHWFDLQFLGQIDDLFEVNGTVEFGGKYIGEKALFLEDGSLADSLSIADLAALLLLSSHVVLPYDVENQLILI